MATSFFKRKRITRDLRRRVAETAETCAAEARVELSSLSIKGLDGQNFQLQIDDDATVEDVYTYISEKIGLKPGRKLLLTSGCTILEASKPLLPQVQNEEISFVIQRMHFCEVVKSFQRTTEAETANSLTAVDMNAVKTIVSLANVRAFNFELAGISLLSNLKTLTFEGDFEQSLAGVRLPSSLQTLTFRYSFNQSLAGVTLPSSLQTLTFGDLFNQSLAGVKLPSSLQTLTFGSLFNQSLAGVTLPNSLQSLTFGFNFNKSFGRCDIAKQPAEFDLWIQV